MKINKSILEEALELKKDEALFYTDDENDYAIYSEEDCICISERDIYDEEHEVIA